MAIFSGGDPGRVQVPLLGVVPNELDRPGGIVGLSGGDGLVRESVGDRHDGNAGFEAFSQQNATYAEFLRRCQAGSSRGRKGLGSWRPFPLLCSGARTKGGQEHNPRNTSFGDRTANFVSGMRIRVRVPSLRRRCAAVLPGQPPKVAAGIGFSVTLSVFAKRATT